jgi:hypothetical protein
MSRGLCIVRAQQQTAPQRHMAVFAHAREGSVNVRSTGAQQYTQYGPRHAVCCHTAARPAHTEGMHVPYVRQSKRHNAFAGVFECTEAHMNGAH